MNRLEPRGAPGVHSAGGNAGLFPAAMKRKWGTRYIVLRIESGASMTVCHIGERQLRVEGVAVGGQEYHAGRQWLV